MTWPIDSSEAAELREREAERARAYAEQQAALDAERARRQREHELYCHKGWIGSDDDHPRPCLICRPTLGRVACRGCGEHPARCRSGVEQGRGACCPQCAHERTPR